MACQLRDGFTAAPALVCVFLLSCVMACVDTIPASLCVFGLGFLFFLVLGRSFKAALKAILAVNFFILFIWLIVPWTTPGTTLLQAGFLDITLQGIAICAMATLKANGILFLFLAIMAGMTPFKLGAALAQLHISHKLAFLIVFAAQQIETLRRRWKSLWEAALLRGFVPGTNFHTWKTSASMLAFMLLEASDRAKTLHEALLLRAFTGKFPVCCSASMDKKDWLLAIATFVSACLLLTINWLGGRVF